MLVARAAAASARLDGADPARRAEVAAAARRESARLSARLDASPLSDDTADAVDEREAQGLAPVPQVTATGPAGPAAPSGSGWARALKLEGMPTQEVAAVEYANLLATFDAEPGLAGDLFERPLDTLAAAHGLLCRGLVEPDSVGRLRRSAQAIHDGAEGRIIYTPPEPERLPGLLEGLAGWLGRGSAGLAGVLVAGIVHERILEWQPFEAANGRLARMAARLVLRARGLDPHGTAVPERVLAGDPLGYHREVAATIRRRGDLGPWLERSVEATATALEAAADAADPRPVPLPERARRLASGMASGEALTVATYAETAGSSHERARADLRALERAGLLRPEPGTRGLRWRRI